MPKTSYDRIKEIIANMGSDIEKFYDKEQNAAGTRLRKSLKEITDVIKEEKTDIVNVRNARKK